MSKSTLAKVEEFHNTYGLLVAPNINITDEKLNALRVGLIQEELDELTEALADKDSVEVLDALTDLQYVLDGAYLSFGLQRVKDIAFEEVHRSNMSKLGEDGQPIYREEDGKVLKGPNFSPPNLSEILVEYGAA